MPDEERGVRPLRGAERRRDTRTVVDFPVVIALPDGEHQARLRDVSQSGVCFFLDRRIPEMTILQMEFDLPRNTGGEEAHVTGGGVVVRCQPVSQHVDHYEVAVFLNDLSSENRERLAQYVSSQAG